MHKIFYAKIDTSLLINRRKTQHTYILKVAVRAITLNTNVHLKPTSKDSNKGGVPKARGLKTNLHVASVHYIRPKSRYKNDPVKVNIANSLSI